MSEPELPRRLKHAVCAAAESLKRDGIAIYPTETFYALGASVASAKGLARIAQLKRRDPGRPMPVIAADEESACALFQSVPPEARLLMHSFWPGPLTIVLPAREGLFAEVAPRGEVGVRVSPNAIAQALARAVGPIVATSANPSGGPERSRVDDIDPALRGAVDQLIDAGATPGGRSSTVISLAGPPTILREGAIGRVLLDACLTGAGGRRTAG